MSANKTARLSLRVFVPSSAVIRALNAFGLFARAAAESRSHFEMLCLRREQLDITSSTVQMGSRNGRDGLRKTAADELREGLNERTPQSLR